LYRNHTLSPDRFSIESGFKWRGCARRSATSKSDGVPMRDQVITVLTKSVPNAYLAFLRSKGVSYIFVRTEKVTRLERHA
jgi:hypothetical protein